MTPSIARRVTTSKRKPPRLVFQFALLTGLGLALAGATIVLAVRHFERQRAEQAAVAEARLTAAFVADRLDSSDFATAPPAKRRAELDVLLGRLVLVGDVVGASLVGPSGAITYTAGATDAPDPDLVGAALRGIAATGMTRITNDDGEKIDALSASVPVEHNGAPMGALVLTRGYGRIAAAARSALIPVILVLELVLLGLWVALFPMLARATRRLRRQMELIEHLAFHDVLTDLPNRAVFHDQVSELLAAERSARISVMLLDLDRFKEVNDTLGHGTGDRLLTELGHRLAADLGDEAIVARLGGDEFGIASPTALDTDSAIALAERAREVVSRPIELEGLSLEMHASVGIALAPGHGTDVEALLRHADVALYGSKTAHRPLVYARDFDHNSTMRLTLAAELRAAVAAGDQLVAYFQPQIDPTDGTVLGAEALVRWHHPTRGFLPPDEFIPIAERTGLARSITRIVLDQALERSRMWALEGMPLDIYVNLAGCDLVDVGFPDEVGRMLSLHGVAPERLHLEITEGALASDRARAADVLGRLRALNVRIALDDFGTGWSSLGDLGRLPVDIIKIDRSFVMRMGTTPSDGVIVRSTIELAHSLGLQAVAEGVEDAENLVELSRLGCDGAQGFHISRPLPPDAMDAWLRARPGRDGKHRADLHVLPRLSGAPRAATG